MFLKRLFCRHMFERKFSIQSERKGDHNYVYDYDHLECKCCGYTYQIRTLKRFDRGYYKNNLKQPFRSVCMDYDFLIKELLKAIHENQVKLNKADRFHNAMYYRGKIDGIHKALMLIESDMWAKEVFDSNKSQRLNGEVEELVTCELCFFVEGDLLECDKCGRYFCEDCGSYGECLCDGCKQN